jgi:hypothetical protein
MSTIGNLICLTPLESYSVDDPRGRDGFLGRLERRLGPFIRSPGIGFPYIVGFLRKNGVIGDATQVAVQHDKLEGITPFRQILEDKVDLSRGDHDVLFITAYTNSAREAYRRAREARSVWAEAGRKLTVVLGGAHASAVPEEGTRFGHVDAAMVGEGEWTSAELLNDIASGRKVKPVYRANFERIRDRGALTFDPGIWRGLARPPQQIVASTHFARGCKLDCQFCGVLLTSGPKVRNRDVRDVADEIRMQGPAATRETVHELGPGIYNSIIRALVKTPLIGSRYGDRIIAKMGPGFSDQVLFWDDNLYNSHGAFRSLCEAIRPLGRKWGAELTIDLAEKPELLKLAYDSGCRDLFLGIESVSQTAINGLEKWSNNSNTIVEMVKRVHDAGINVMGAFVFGLEGDDPSSFDRTLEFIFETDIDFVVANIIQPYPGTGTFRDAVAGNTFLPQAVGSQGSDVDMEYNWPLFDGAHVITRPKGMTVEQLQEGYYHFLREAYSITGILRRFRGSSLDAPGAISHLTRNYLLSRYGMNKTAHAMSWKAAKRSPLVRILPVKKTPPRAKVTAAAPAADGP